MDNDIEDELRSIMSTLSPRQRANIIGNEILRSPNMDDRLKARIIDWILSPYRLEERLGGLWETYNSLIKGQS